MKNLYRVLLISQFLINLKLFDQTIIYIKHQKERQLQKLKIIKNRLLT